MKIVNELPPVTTKDDLICLDVETFGQVKGKIHRPTGTFACLSINFGDGNVYQIYDEKQVRPALKNLNKGTWIFHNATYDLTQLRRFTTIEPRHVWDTMLVEKSMTGGLYSDYGLADLSRRWLGEYMEKEERSEFETATSMTKEMKKYAAMDVIKTWMIASLQMEEYKDDLGFRAYSEIDEPAIFPVLDMPGMRVDVPAWTKAVIQFKERATEIEAELGFNVKSSQQCLVALNQAGIRVKSTGAPVLLAFANNPLVQKITEGRLYRDASSAKYGLPWLEEYVESDGKVYAHYNITQAETGRMSASNPAMQGIPVRKLPIYRTFFIASPGHTIVVTDISQQEPRILAYETKDDALIEAFKTGEDVHIAVARSIYGDFDETHPDYKERRNVGKTINLGTSYGLSAFGLADKLNISEEDAERILRQYFTKFRGVLSWISLQRMNARRTGFVKTAIGRRIYLNPYSQHFDNNAINAPIQGGAADFTKMWVRKIWEGCRSEGIAYPVVEIVHDEIVADVPNKELKQYKKVKDTAFKATAEKLYKGVPFEAETEQGPNWGVKQFKNEITEEDDAD